jgi:hypothetical protein
MANSDYTIRSQPHGFCPVATLAASLTPLATGVAIANYVSPIPDGIRLGMAALIDNEIVVVTGIAGSNLTIGRGCCDTVPAAHSSGARIWFFDDSISNDGVEYGATETISVKLLPRTTSQGHIPVAYAPPNGKTFNRRFIRPYPPGLVTVNGAPFPGNHVLNDSTPTLAIAWAHRNRVTQQDVLVDHAQASITPEVGTTYTARVYNASDVLVRTQAGLAGGPWNYTLAQAKSDLSIASGSPPTPGYITLVAVRDGYESFQGYRIDFTAVEFSWLSMTAPWSSYTSPWTTY